jgi:hypothetical protein
MLVMCACGKKEEPTTATTSSSQKPVNETATTPPAKAKTCAEYGGTGDGTWEKQCQLTGSGPFEVVATDELMEDHFGGKVRAMKVTNKGDRDVDLLTYEVYYYDKEGQRLGKPATTGGNGGNVAPAGKTTLLPLGKPKTEEPSGVSKIEAEILFWVVGEGKAQMFFQGYSNKLNSELDARPMGGWPAK